uniref:Putative receptor protein kinase TMK1 n=1 Tax=Populus alba TaxID=43335 RepID=A0A4U5LSQ6_POPAL|nr:putative receptor protein kinase TMK1 [Populus alba]
MKLCNLLFFLLLLGCVTLGYSVTDPNDLKILLDFQKGLENPELLKWPANGDDPCGPPLWPHVFCSDGRVTQIQVQSMGLKGPLPQNFNQLSKLYNIGLQRNNFTGKLPTFKGLSELEFAFLDYNNFDTIPSDFFVGLSSLRVLALDSNPLNESTGWSLPSELADSVQLTNLSASSSNLAGSLPDFLGSMQSLSNLRLSYNRLSGEIPASFEKSLMSTLLLNNQEGGGMSGPIDVIASMTSLSQLWLHGNSFTGTIPENIGDLSLLRDLNLNGNKLVGLVPQSLADMPLDNLDLSNNQLMGPVPNFKAGKVSYESNPFCQSKPGVECAPEVNALLDFLGGVNYPSILTSQWSGNDPCQGSWLGLNCDSKSKVSVINLLRHNLTGTLSPSIARLDSLIEIDLGGNSIKGTIPSNFTNLNSLRLLDVSGNNLGPPLPKFRNSVKLVVDGNPLLDGGNQTHQPPSSASSPPAVSFTPPENPPRGSAPPSPSTMPFSPPSPTSISNTNQRTKLVTVGGIFAGSLLTIVLIALCLYCCFKKRKEASNPPSSIVVHPRDPSDPENIVKIAFSNNTIRSLSTQTGISSVSNTSNLTENSSLVESGNVAISVQVLRKVTDNFAQKNQLGSGGFGIVYKGELEDGTKIAVKRMEAGVMGSKAGDEFQAEIAVLSKVRHRHLVSLLGYSIEGNERLLVYEYMPQGALIMGKITTKVDVFSYGVVLMELLTGLTALDEERPEESRYLAEWFWRIKSSKEKLMAAIDPALNVNDETFESISSIAELAGHCTSRDPNHRPDMGHAVNVLVPLVEKWKPVNDESEDFYGIDYSQPLPEMLKVWQDADSTGLSNTSLSDSKGSIPARPAGFAESSTSNDGR